jgi:hypothetical protein
VATVIYKTKNYLAKFFIILMGVILGGLVGEILGSIPGLGFLKTGVQIGFIEPVTVSLMVIEFTIGLIFKINVMSIVGAWAGYVVKKKIIE